MGQLSHTADGAIVDGLARHLVVALEPEAGQMGLLTRHPIRATTVGYIGGLVWYSQP